jgi:hypothetical protein
MDDMEENDGCGGLLASIWAFAGILFMVIVIAVVATVVIGAVAVGAAV